MRFVLSFMSSSCSLSSSCLSDFSFVYIFRFNWFFSFILFRVSLLHFRTHLVDNISLVPCENLIQEYNLKVPLEPPTLKVFYFHWFVIMFFPFLEFLEHEIFEYILLFVTIVVVPVFFLFWHQIFCISHGQGLCGRLSNLKLTPSGEKYMAVLEFAVNSTSLIQQCFAQSMFVYEVGNSNKIAGLGALGFTTSYSVSSCFFNLFLYPTNSFYIN